MAKPAMIPAAPPFERCLSSTCGDIEDVIVLESDIRFLTLEDFADVNGEDDTLRALRPHQARVIRASLKADTARLCNRLHDGGGTVVSEGHEALFPEGTEHEDLADVRNDEGVAGEDRDLRVGGVRRIGTQIDLHGLRQSWTMERHDVGSGLLFTFGERKHLDEGVVS